MKNNVKCSNPADTQSWAKMKQNEKSSKAHVTYSLFPDFLNISRFPLFTLNLWSMLSLTCLFLTVAIPMILVRKGQLTNSCAYGLETHRHSRFFSFPFRRQYFKSHTHGFSTRLHRLRIALRVGAEGCQSPFGVVCHLNIRFTVIALYIHVIKHKHDSRAGRCRDGPRAFFVYVVSRVTGALKDLKWVYGGC